MQIFVKKFPKLDFSCPKEIWWLDRKINPKDLLFYRIVHFSKDLSSHSLINVFFLLLLLFSQNMLKLHLYHQFLLGHEKSNFRTFFTKIYMHVQFLCIKIYFTKFGKFSDFKRQLKKITFTRWPGKIQFSKFLKRILEIIRRHQKLPE